MSHLIEKCPNLYAVKIWRSYDRSDGNRVECYDVIPMVRLVEERIDPFKYPDFVEWVERTTPRWPTNFRLTYDPKRYQIIAADLSNLGLIDA